MMKQDDDPSLELTPELLLKAYSVGIFPMAESADDPEVFWVEPEQRGILPLDEFHLPRSLRKFMKKNPFQVTINTAFSQVMELCAEETPARGQTWINDQIFELCNQLHAMGFAHSLECWDGEKLVGGLYGVSLGSAFFGESMFSRATNASKVALVHLIYRLRRNGFTLLDTQFTTAHLEKFGVIEISKESYSELLREALSINADFTHQDGGGTSDSILQSFNQIS